MKRSEAGITTLVDKEPEDWGLDYDWYLIDLAWMAWKRSNAALPPMPEDITKYDPQWLSDVYLYDDLIKFQHGKLPDIKPPTK